MNTSINLKSKFGNVIDTSMKKKREDLILLSTTRKIHKEDLLNELWVSLKTEYKRVNKEGNTSPHKRALCSIINALLTQQRVAFAITRDSLQKLIKEDPNYTKKGLSFDNNLYPSIIKFLVDGGLFEVAFQSPQKPLGFILKDTDVLSALRVDLEEQRLELETFLTRSKTKNAPRKAEKKPSEKPTELPTGSLVEFLKQYPTFDFKNVPLIATYIKAQNSDSSSFDQVLEEILAAYFTSETDKALQLKAKAKVAIEKSLSSSPKKKGPGTPPKGIVLRPYVPDPEALKEIDEKFRFEFTDADFD